MHKVSFIYLPTLCYTFILYYFDFHFNKIFIFYSRQITNEMITKEMKYEEKMKKKTNSLTSEIAHDGMHMEWKILSFVHKVAARSGCGDCKYNTTQHSVRRKGSLRIN